jgi:hypothetical protein
MFDIFIKKSEVILDCFTNVGTVYDTAKINNAVHFIPDWWKNTPKVQEGWATIKNCKAFKDYYKHGIVIPSWFEMEISFFGEDGPDGKEIGIKYSNDNVDITKSHNHYQFDKFTQHDGKNLKIMSPWAFRTKEDIKFVWSHPAWNTRESMSYLSALPGVIDFKYQHHVAINFLMIQPIEPLSITVEPLEPLVMLHPMTEKRVVIKNHLISDNEYKRLFAIQDLVLKRDVDDEIKEYDKKKSLTKKIEKMSCPFKY